MASPLQLKESGFTYLVDPETLALERVTEAETISLSSSQVLRKVDNLEVEEGQASWDFPEEGLAIECRILASGAFELTARGEPGSRFHWPAGEVEKSARIILARNSGLLVSPDDPFWRDILLATEWDTLEKMSMPVFGFLDGKHGVSWMTSSVFRNELDFEESGSSSSLSFTFSHHFHPKSSENEITFRVIVDENASPISPALYYREWLDETGRVTTLKQKMETVPQVERLPGAPHVYLWGGSAVSWLDIQPRALKEFCTSLISEMGDPESVAARLRAHFSGEQWKQVEQCVQEEWPHKYMKQQIAAGISAALESTEFGSDSPDPANRLQENAAILVEAFPNAFLPPEVWGNGDSIKMLKGLADLGFANLKLCFPGWESVEQRPWVATDADNRGWLIGTYDSYHSIHNPASAGTDNTWTTAQMTSELWENGGVMQEDGTFLRGFKGIGRKLNPLAGRVFYEERTSAILKSVPFNYYFIDCDAYGEVYDDYHPEHPNSMEEDAEERTRRLGWLASEKNVVVGSEGGNIYALEGVHVLEGVFGPYFGWGDEDLMNPDSDFFRGKYYPPDQPGINFKPVPMKEKYRKLHYDPAVRIPLFQAAFHDAVITTHHWSNDRFKYPEMTKTVELFELLWMCPPMVHLNLQTLKERGTSLKRHCEIWSPLHRKLGFARMTGFRYLTDDHLVQETTWEDGTRIVVNFGESGYEDKGVVVESGKALVQ